MTHLPPESIAAMTAVRVQHPFPCEQKRREPLGADPTGGNVVVVVVVVLLLLLLLLSGPFSSMATERAGIVFRAGRLLNVTSPLSFRRERVEKSPRDGAELLFSPGQQRESLRLRVASRLK